MRTPEENKRYMRAYYLANKDKFNKRTPEKAEQRNAERRERYATDFEFRERAKASARKRAPETRREQSLRKNYGIGATEYDAILARQGGGCAICGAGAGSLVRGEHLHVDHCHDTGKVRGILCTNCNTGIGKFKDNTDRMARAIEYLWEARR